MSAIQNGKEDVEPINVLFALYDNFSALDFTGALETLTHAQHDPADANTKAFECTFAASAEHTLAAPSGCSFRAHINYKEAHSRLSEFDLLVVPGGPGALALFNSSTSATSSEPLALIKAFAELQSADPSRERTLLAISTASLLLAQTGLLSGLAATIPPEYYIKLENACKSAATRDLSERTDVMDNGERYVVNNARFDLGENPDENPYIYTRKERKTSVVARKGSMSWKQSNSRRESNARRAAMKLGGLRVITTGGSAAGLDASLYLVSAMVSNEVAEEVARLLDYKWNKGVVVDSIDV